MIGVQENFDSSQKRISRVQAVVTGLVGAEFRSATSDKTREALRLAFEQGFRVGGKIYGYDIVTTDVQYKPGMFRKRLVVNQTTAAVVRRIFEMYADGNSLVGIATRLNNEAVPSAGANWKRTKRRADSKWLNSAVHAIIENPTYTGQLRNGQTYSHTLERRDDGLRMFVEPTEQVLERTDESLRIISQELWQRVRARQVKQSATAGEKVKEGLHKRARAGDCGRQRYLLSGMLRCGVCGGSFQMTNRTRYQCSSHHNGGDAACRVGLSVLRDRLEERVINYIERDLLVPGRLAELERRLRSATSIGVDYAPRIAEIVAREKNLAAAIAAGGDMSALVAALKAAQSERERLERMERTASAMATGLPIPSVVSYESRVLELKEKIAEGGDVAREAVAEITGGRIQLDVDDSGRFFWAIFEDGIRAALLPEAQLMGVEYSDPSVFGKVESSGSGGRILRPCRGAAGLRAYAARPCLARLIQRSPR